MSADAQAAMRRDPVAAHIDKRELHCVCCRQQQGEAEEGPAGPGEKRLLYGASGGIAELFRLTRA